MKLSKVHFLTERKINRLDGHLEAIARQLHTVRKALLQVTEERPRIIGASIVASSPVVSQQKPQLAWYAPLRFPDMSALDELFRDLPQIHTSAPDGLWLTDRDCYEFIESRCQGARTLETGIGLSTVLFTQLVAEHACVAPSQDEVNACVAYLDHRQIDRSHLTFHVGWSEDVLPRLDPTPLDLVLIDGGHAWPFPIIDWYYAGSRLVTGGFLVVDDRQLPAVSKGFLQFLDRDPHWKQVACTPKWCAYQRVTNSPLREGWGDQHDRGMFRWPKMSFAARVRGRVARIAARQQ